MSKPWEDSSDRICIFHSNSESCPCRQQASTWSHEVGEDYPKLLHGRFSKEQWDEFLSARDTAWEPVEASQRKFHMIFFPLLIFTSLSFISWFILPMLGVPIWLLMAAWALGFLATLTVACVFQCKDVEDSFFETLLDEWKEQFKAAGLNLSYQCVTVGSGKRKHFYCWLEITAKGKKRSKDAESSSSSSSSSDADDPCWLSCFKVTGHCLLILFAVVGCTYGFALGVVMLVDINDREHGTCFFPAASNGCAEVTTTPSPTRRLHEEQTHEPQTRERSLLTARRQLLSCEDGLTWSCTSQTYGATKSRSAYTSWEVSWPDIRFEPNDFTSSPLSCKLFDEADGRSSNAEDCNEKGLQQSRAPAACYHYSGYEWCWLGDTSTGEFYMAVLMLAWGIVSWCMALLYCAWRKKDALKSFAVSHGIMERSGSSKDVDETSDESSESSDSNDKQKSTTERRKKKKKRRKEDQEDEEEAEEGAGPVVVTVLPGSAHTRTG